MLWKRVIPLFFYLLRTLKLHSPSKPQLCNTVLSTLVTMLYIRSPHFTHFFITELIGVTLVNTISQHIIYTQYCVLPAPNPVCFHHYLPPIRSSASTTPPPASHRHTIVCVREFSSLFFSIPPPTSNCLPQQLSACCLHFIAESLYSFIFKGSFARPNLKQYRLKAKQ